MALSSSRIRRHTSADVGGEWWPASALRPAAAPTSGQLRVFLIHVPEPATITNIHSAVSGAGTGLTSGQNFAVLYDADNDLVGITADQTTAWGTTGDKTMALTTPHEVSAPALFKVGYWSVGSTPPSFARTATGNAIPLNIGLPGPGTYRAATADTGLTTTAPGPSAHKRRRAPSICWR